MTSENLDGVKRYQNHIYEEVGGVVCRVAHEDGFDFRLVLFFDCRSKIVFEAVVGTAQSFIV